MHQKIQQKWLDNISLSGKSKHTVDAYQRALKHFSRWYKHHYKYPIDPNKIRINDIYKWIQRQQLIDGFAPATINQRLVALNNFFQWAKIEGLCNDNPMQDIKTIRLSKNEPDILEKENLQHLLRVAQGNLRDYAIIETLVGTGIRVGELLALQVGDVKINNLNSSITIHSNNAKNQRDIPLSLNVCNALKIYLYQLHPNPNDDKEALWYGRKGVLTNRSSIKRLLSKYAKLAGISRVYPHMLRHTYAVSYLNINPGDFDGLIRLLGHHDLNTIMIYAKSDENELCIQQPQVETKK